MTAAGDFAKTVPMGFAPIFTGWNVWGVWQKDDLDFEALMVGLDRDRRLRIWVEEKADDAPGVEVGDPANPVALRGSQVEIIPTDAGLTATRRKEQVPGAIMLLDSKPTMRFVRFYNRGKPGARPWPVDANYLLDAVFEPEQDNPVTSGDAPASLAGSADKAGAAISTGFKILAGVAAAGLVAFLLVRVLDARERRAA